MTLSTFKIIQCRITDDYYVNNELGENAEGRDGDQIKVLFQKIW